MNFLSNFYHFTRHFWAISRFMLILLFGYALFFMDGFSGITEVLRMGSFGLYTLIMLFILGSSLLKKSVNINFFKFTGLFSILFGLFSSYITLIYLGFSAALVIPAWIILFGIRDLVFSAKTDD